MKKFLFEYKALKSKSETETSKNRNKVDSTQDMGVFKWLRRERVTLSTHNGNFEAAEEPQSRSTTHVGTIRTEEYKRDLAEFQARRSLGTKELPDTPIKKKYGRHSLPVSCTDCAADHDNTFNYEKKSAVKYKKKTHKRARSAAEEKNSDGVPNIQFLFQNQVFMPGMPYSEPPKSKCQSRRIYRSSEVAFSVQKHIDFDDDQPTSPPLFYKNNSLPFDVKHFLDSCERKDEEEVDGDCKSIKDHKSSSLSSEQTCDEKLWEVINELNHLEDVADQHLQRQSSSKSDDIKSDTSACGLPMLSPSNLDVEIDKEKTWNCGKWGVEPVLIKKLHGVTADQVTSKLNTEINILRKFRHPNIILLMGLYSDIYQDINIVCEKCIDTLFGIIHIQGRILSVQSSVKYCVDIANALVFLRMQGYIHTELSSVSVMVNSHDVAKLADLAPCAKIEQKVVRKGKNYDVYSPEPQYINIDDIRELENSPESEPLLSQNSSEVYLLSNAVLKPYKSYRESELYRWQAPELFEDDIEGLVYPCAKSDVYSLCLVLWECCNASIPFKNCSYDKLKDSYTSWKSGIPLPQDGTYPGCLLAVLQSGLKLSRSERLDLNMLQDNLQTVKRNIEDLDYIIIPAQVNRKKSDFSSVGWDAPTDESEYQSPVKNLQHKALVHERVDSSTSGDGEEDKDTYSPIYETIRKDIKFDRSINKPYILNDKNIQTGLSKYGHLPEREFSSACSTPVSKVRAKLIGTPGELHRSDSTEYCSILSPDYRGHNMTNNYMYKDDGVERPTTKLSRSFTPKSYKPLHIKVPECNFDTVKPILKEQTDSARSSYNFDIKNYSLPTTPIARSNKLRRNAWLSGDLTSIQRSAEKLKQAAETLITLDDKKARSAPETPASNVITADKETNIDDCLSKQLFITDGEDEDEPSPENIDDNRDSYTGLRRIDPPADFSPEAPSHVRESTSSWTFKPFSDKLVTKFKVEEDVLANINVKPLVAIHERWIYEANRKTGRSVSLPGDNRCQIPAVKPASHCVDTLQKSLPQLNLKRKPFRTHPTSPISSGKNGGNWEQFCQAREAIAKSINFNSRESDKYDKHTWKRDIEKSNEEIQTQSVSTINRSTDTESIEEFIKELIRKEFQHLLHELSDDGSITSSRREDINKGVANIIESLGKGENTEKGEVSRPYSKIKINGNNKPLLQITFSKTGENSLQVLDNCVNVTIADSHYTGKEKLNLSFEDTLIEDMQVHSLKRCQTFNAIQEARSTEDLYIDDDLSTQLQENFGGKVKLIPLHGSLHEILCEKEDDCCLIKVKQENGCDTIYFRCDNSDTESRDAIDGCPEHRRQDTIVYKRSISLVEERIQNIFPKEIRASPIPCRRAKRNDKLIIRPKSEILHQNINRESRILSNSSPSLLVKDLHDEVEVNIENVMSYQDSSSDECLKCQIENDDFELLERKIEEDLEHNSNIPSLNCGYLEKISEENLSTSVEEINEKN